MVSKRQSVYLFPLTFVYETSEHHELSISDYLLAFVCRSLPILLHSSIQTRFHRMGQYLRMLHAESGNKLLRALQNGLHGNDGEEKVI